MKCVVRYCGRCSKKFPQYSFFTFPADGITRYRWITFCRLESDVEIKPSSRICSAHFEETCFKSNLKGRKLRREDVVPVPTIDAFLLDPDSDVEHDFFKSRPLYSSPALYDHNYANFVTVVPDWVEFEGDEDRPEIVASSNANGCTGTAEMERYLLGEEARCEELREISAVEDTETTSEIELNLLGEEATYETLGEISAVGDKGSTSGGMCSDLVHDVAKKKTAFKLFREANKWKERAKKWKSKATYWKNKYTTLNKNPSVLKKLKTVFRNDQMGIVLGNLKKVRKWSNETLVEGLQTRFACGSGYDKVRQLPYVALPSYSCLLSKIKSVHFDTGILHEVFDLLQHKVSTMSGNELDCGIILDEMSIDEAVEFCTNNQKYFGTNTMPPSDELATHALVFMLAGIHVRWKQIIAYEFTGNSIPKNCLKSIVDQIISKAESIGLKVHFVTSDCGASNKAMWLDYGVSTKKNTILNDLSIEHPVDASRRLEFIPDPVHVFKNAVNGWISNATITLPQWYVEKRGLTTNEVNRDHLTLLIRHEQEQKLKMAHRLVEADVDFENSKTTKVDKMKVSNSTKYCNHSVAAALMVLSENAGYEHLKATSVYLEDLSRWYDLMNSRSSEDALSLSDRSKYEANINHLNMMVKLVYDIKVGADGHWKPWQAALIMATNAIIRLQSRLLVDSGYPILFTSRFTQDCVENLFSVVRSKQRRPTPLQFKSHLRTITLSQYMLEVRNASYDTDDREYLSGFMDHLKFMDNNQSASMQSTPYIEETLDFSNVELSTRAKQIFERRNNAENNALFHVSGYIMGSIRKNSATCFHCLQNCITPVPFDRTYGRFSSLVASAKGRPYSYASEKIFHFITCLDSIIQEHFLDKSTINRTKIDLAQKTLMSLPPGLSPLNYTQLHAIVDSSFQKQNFKI